MHKIIIGDCLEVMREMDSESIDLIYADPPFNTGRDWVDYNDQWNSDADYIGWVAARLCEMHRLLKPTGSIYLHCDQNMSHYIKVEMDKIWGRTHFRNDIIWERMKGNKNTSKKFGNVCDHILFYVTHPKADEKFNVLRKWGDISHFIHDDNDGRGRYHRGNTSSPTINKKNQYTFMGKSTPKGWRYSIEKMQELHDNNELVFSTKGNFIWRKQYLSDYKGVAINNLWYDINDVRKQNKEYLGYATQKPLELVSRIVQSSSNKGDLVLDPFAGSGTTVEAAFHLDRNSIGIEINPHTPAIERIEKLQERLV